MTGVQTCALPIFIQENDWEKEKELLGISGIVSEILEEARIQNGIFTRFPLMLPVAF